jgi:hypothetical protein
LGGRLRPRVAAPAIAADPVSRVRRDTSMGDDLTTGGGSGPVAAYRSGMILTL